MSFVTTQPEALSAAATSLQGIGAGLNAQNASAAAPTTGVVPAAADEVSALTPPSLSPTLSSTRQSALKRQQSTKRSSTRWAPAQVPTPPPRLPTQPLRAECRR